MATATDSSAVTRPIRVLHVVGDTNRGGAETWLVHLLPHIDRESVAMDFVVHHARPGAYAQTITRCGARIFVVEAHRNLFRQWRGLRMLQQTHGPFDIVHSHTDFYSGAVVALARFLGFRGRIVHSHGGVKPGDSSSPLRRAYFQCMRILMHRFSTTGIGVSESAAEMFFGPNWRSDARWKIMQPCVDLAPFHQLQDRALVRAELGIPHDAFVIGHVGRLVEQKNHGFFIDIAGRLAAADARIHFLVVGGGPLHQHIVSTLRERGLTDRFTLLPPRGDVPRLLSGAMDFFLFPSRYEGLGLALVEAQAAGLRCLASSAIPPEAIVLPSLVRQLPLSAGPEAWSAEILAQWPWDHPTPIDREQALQAVEQVFDIRRNAQQLIELYQAAS